MYINREGLQFSRRDTFDYTTLGGLMIAWLEKFKEHGKHGCPGIYLPDNKDKYTDEEIDAGIELMYKDIDMLIWALEDHDPDVDVGEHGWIQAHKEYERKRKEGLALFTKLYCNLWR